MAFNGAPPRTGTDWSGHEAAPLIQEIIELRHEQTKLKAEYDDKRDALFRIHEREGVETAVGPGWKSLIIRPNPFRRLSREKLIAAGVPIETINAAYVVTPRNPYVTVKDTGLRHHR